MPPILQAIDVHKAYAAHVALNGVSLDIPEGSIFGLLGPNGAGKTSLIRIITQITGADSGEIRFRGERLNPSHIGHIGYLPEERGLYKKMKVGEQLLYLAQLKGLTKADATQRIKSWIDRLDLRPWVGKNVEDLSKGMQQKVQFIATVLHEPSLIILDEPFSGLDPVNAEVLKDAVLDLKREGTTVVFSTHDMGVAERMCDRIFMIYLGKKVLDGTLDEIQSAYGQDTIVVRSAGGRALLEGLPGVEDVRDYGQEQKVRFSGDPQELLRTLVERTTVTHFEVARPSLHDIFVRIAAPEREVSIHAMA
jgi:ABC-2 type transport system ATP-binding protein